MTLEEAQSVKPGETVLVYSFTKQRWVTGVFRGLRATIAELDVQFTDGSGIYRDFLCTLDRISLTPSKRLMMKAKQHDITERATRPETRRSVGLLAGANSCDILGD